MTKLPLAILAAFLLAVSASAQSQAFSLQWLANPAGDAVTAYNVYEHVGATYTLLGSTGPTVLTFSLGTPTAGVHLYAVSAVNVRGESPKSLDATLPTVATAPTGLKVTSP